jgi:hypothetical protein
MDHPTVSRVVHYVAYGTPGGEFPAGVCRAAVVTQVHVDAGDVGVQEDSTPDVGLCVLNPTGLFFNVRVPYAADGPPGTWHWPERV